MLEGGGSRQCCRGWRLAAGGWRLAAGGWRLTAGGRRMTVGEWRMANGGARLAMRDAPAHRRTDAERGVGRCIDRRQFAGGSRAEPAPTARRARAMQRSSRALRMPGAGPLAPQARHSADHYQFW
ncbi:hypothetical protein [Burkholderia savannae]|uniref:hypothetical protein n=1 Tax=Burkholderia savannae TaxID=1637837 RepID=UPI0012E3F708|nr:hypothetical protein [Burkholderia savannae]